jgi:hypothetical protein
MIVHVVLFEPRPELSEDCRQRVFDDLRRSAEAIPSVRRVRVGRRVRHGIAGYERAMADDYSFAAVIEFEDLSGLKAYLQHPSHETIGRHFRESALRALAYDYAMFDAAQPDTAAQLLAQE